MSQQNNNQAPPPPLRSPWDGPLDNLQNRSVRAHAAAMSEIAYISRLEKLVGVSAELREVFRQTVVRMPAPPVVLQPQIARPQPVNQAEAPQIAQRFAPRHAPPPPPPVAEPEVEDSSRAAQLASEIIDALNQKLFGRQT